MSNEMKNLVTVLVCSAFAAVPAAAQVKISPGPEKIGVEINGKAFGDFYVAGKDTTKPYLWPLRAASGTYVTRMWPMEKVEEEASIAKPDHQHQRGLWFAHDNVNHLDFWNNEAGYPKPETLGKMVLKGEPQLQSGKDKGSLTATFEWVDMKGEHPPLLTEKRVMTFYSDKDARIFDVDILLTALQMVTFGDGKDGVLGIRMRPILQEDKGTGHLANADGLETEKALWGKPSPWCDYSGVINGEKVGITIMDNPGNPRFPVRWHARAYGLFAANPFGLAALTNDKTLSGAITLSPSQTLHYRYRIIVHAGDLKAANIPAQWARYTAAK
jgi:hypothetical protein